MRNYPIYYYKDIQFFLLCGLAGFPILPKTVHSILIMLMGFLAILHVFVNGRKYWSKEKTKYLVVLSSLFVIYLCSLIYTGNITSGLRYVARLSPIILLVLVFLAGKTPIMKTERIQKLFTIYSMSLLVLLSFLYFYFFKEIYNKSISPWELRGYVEELVNVHGTYLSMWIGMGILIKIWLLFIKRKIFWLRIAYVFSLLFFFYWLFIIGARMPFFATLISAFFLVLYLLKLSIRTIVIIFFAVAVCGVTVFKTQVFSKFNELSSYENAIPAGKYENTNPLISNENIRSVIYYCTLKNILKKPIFGYGVGNINQQLQSCYDNEFSHTDLFKRFQFNSHSQYFQIVLSTGLIGFLLYIISSILLARWSFNRCKLYPSFLILVFLCFTFENILYRHDGIIFFSFFNSILFFTEISNHKSEAKMSNRSK